MTHPASMLHPPADLRERLSKVPEVTVYFWVIKVLCTTVGETFADFINGRLGDNLNTTTIVMGSLLVVALVVQFRVPEYIPAVYWVAVVLISVVGTLITDNMVENFNVSLTTSTIVFSILMVASFAVWYVSEGTLSIHSIHTPKREAFYWVAILFTFALGTASGDLITEGLGLGYLVGVILFASLIGVIVIARFVFHANVVFCFWAAYILTRPLGASIGDLLSQAPADGGLGIGATATSVVFLVVIVAVATYLGIKVGRQRRAAALEVPLGEAVAA